mgnify:CR=1 FL=1
MKKYGKPETFHIYEIPYRRYKSRKVKETERLKELLDVEIGETTADRK